MDKELKISAEDARASYNNTDANGRELLEHLFGKEMFQTKDIKERVKTFDDAYNELGEVHPYVKAYTGWMSIYHTDCKDVTAYLKLRIICAALNEGWKPTFSKDERRYFPWFCLYSREQYDKLCYKDKERCVICPGNNTDSYSGFVYYNAYSDASNTYTNFGSRLAFKTRELAEYCGKQFIDIWADYLFA